MRLRELDVATAKKISSSYEKKRILPIKLKRMTKLDAVVARELVKSATAFELNGLTSLDRETAKELAAATWYSLKLNGLTGLDSATAFELAQSQAVNLHLNGLTGLNHSVANELSQFGGLSLYLDGVTDIGALNPNEKAIWDETPKLKASLAKATARELAKFKGRTISLRGLKSVSKATVRELADFRGEIDLRGLASLDEATTKYFLDNPRLEPRFQLPVKLSPAMQRDIKFFKEIHDARE